jgi:sulfur carrier protein
VSLEVTLNGDERSFASGTTVAALVESLGAPGGGRGIAVALDGEVVPRGAWSATPLSDGDRLEIVVAVQGG